MCGLRPPAAGAVQPGVTEHRLRPAGRHHPPGPAAAPARCATPPALPRRARRPDRSTPCCETLELAGRSLIPVGELSGGERKRASIASELLAEPGAVLPRRADVRPRPGARRGADARAARAGRDGHHGGADHAHPGRTPSKCDKVAVLAPGGRLAFFGTPAAARAYFGTGAPWMRSTSGWTGAGARPPAPQTGRPRPPARPRLPRRRSQPHAPAARTRPQPHPARRWRGRRPASGSGCCSPGATPTS